MLQLAERNPPEALDAAQAALLMPEEDNVRAALDWAVQHDQAELGLTTGCGCVPAVDVHRPLRRGQQLARPVLALPQRCSAARTVDGTAVRWQLLADARRLCAGAGAGLAALEEQGARGDALGMALTLEMLGNVALQRGELAEGSRLHGDAAQRKRDLARERLRVSDLLQRGLIAHEPRDVDQHPPVRGEVEGMADDRPAADLARRRAASAGAGGGGRRRQHCRCRAAGAGA